MSSCLKTLILKILLSRTRSLSFMCDNYAYHNQVKCLSVYKNKSSRLLSRYHSYKSFSFIHFDCQRKQKTLHKGKIITTCYNYNSIMRDWKKNTESFEQFSSLHRSSSNFRHFNSVPSPKSQEHSELEPNPIFPPLVQSNATLPVI